MEVCKVFDFVVHVSLSFWAKCWNKNELLFCYSMCEPMKTLKPLKILLSSMSNYNKLQSKMEKPYPWHRFFADSKSIRECHCFISIWLKSKGGWSTIDCSYSTVSIYFVWIFPLRYYFLSNSWSNLVRLKVWFYHQHKMLTN